MGERGIIIGILIMALGFFTIYTFISPDFLFTLGISIEMYNAIQTQWRLWGMGIGIAIIIAGLIAMGKFD